MDSFFQLVVKRIGLVPLVGRKVDFDAREEVIAGQVGKKNGSGNSAQELGLRTHDASQAIKFGDGLALGVTSQQIVSMSREQRDAGNREACALEGFSKECAGLGVALLNRRVSGCGMAQGRKKVQTRGKSKSGGTVLQTRLQGTGTLKTSRCFQHFRNLYHGIRETKTCFSFSDLLLDVGDGQPQAVQREDQQ